MGGTDSKKKIEEEFQIFKIEKDGNALLKSKADSKEYLMRVVICSSQADIDRLKALLECRAQLKNHHLLSLVEIKEKQQDLICSIHFKMYLVLQYSFKNIAQEIKERAASGTESYFQQSDIWSIIYSCCTALNMLYSNGATHQSITAQQIFINKDGFVKMSQPLLFGLEKNHLDAMRTKQDEIINAHLSPQIMSCLDDQNFFYYDKEKSDIFILGMIVVDIALISFNYLYDPIKRKSLQNSIPSLLSKVGQRYSQNLVAVLQQMLKIQSKQRPSFSTIIERVQKCNNIGEEFTVETEANVKTHEMPIQQSKRSNQASNTMNGEVQHAPAKSNITISQAQPIKERQLVSSNIYYTKIQAQSSKYFSRVKQQPFAQQKLYHSPNQMIFDPSKHQKQPIQFNNVKVITNNYAQNQINVQSPEKHHNYMTSNPHPHMHLHQNQNSNVILYRQTQIPSNQAQHQTVIIKNNEQNPHQNHTFSHNQTNSTFNLSNPNLFQQFPQRNSYIQQSNVPQANSSFKAHERSKSIDCVRINNQLHKFQSNLPKYQQPLHKNSGFYEKKEFSGSYYNSSNVYNDIKKDNAQLFSSFNTKFQLENKSKKKEPIFTHQIPEVYNLLVKKTNLPLKVQPPKIDHLPLRSQPPSKIEDFNKDIMSSYPKKPFAQENYKADNNKFTNLRNIPYESISRVSQQQQSNSTTFQNVELKKNISQTHSQRISLPQKQMLTQSKEKSTQQQQKGTFEYSPVKSNFSQNFTNFGQINTVSSNYLLKTPNKKATISEDEANKNKNFTTTNVISREFNSSEQRKHLKQHQSFNRNFYEHKKQISNVNLQFFKEIVPGKGTYQGYKYNNQRHGNGILYFQDGGHYQGQWKNDKMNGFGKLYYENGKIAYQGHWQNDQFNGQGRVYNCEPAVIQGQFNYKDFSQLGNNWIYYEGQFRNDSKHGKGYIMLSNGQTFEGLFDNDMIEGNGIFYKITGEIVLGFWIDNKLFLNQSYEQNKK